MITETDARPTCEVCERPDCTTPIQIDGRDMDMRNCEADGCHVQQDKGSMHRLFRECWYCPEHAADQLKMAAGERALSPDEKTTARDLGLQHLPGGPCESEPDDDEELLTRFFFDDEALPDEFDRAPVERLIELLLPTLHRAGYDTWYSDTRFSVYAGWTAQWDRDGR